jgi:hypothetical protein
MRNRLPQDDDAEEGEYRQARYLDLHHIIRDSLGEEREHEQPSSDRLQAFAEVRRLTYRASDSATANVAIPQSSLII